MDQNTQTRFDGQDLIAVAMLATTAFGAYQLVKLGVDWAKEGARYIKSKKNQEQ